jgi:hypothetical protein
MSTWGSTVSFALQEEEKKPDVVRLVFWLKFVFSSPW